VPASRLAAILTPPCSWVDQRVTTGPIVQINYDIKVLFVRFVGSHAAYDKIDAEPIKKRERPGERSETDSGADVGGAGTIVGFAFCLVLSVLYCFEQYY
jgi:hypothetical protein